MNRDMEGIHRRTVRSSDRCLPNSYWAATAGPQIELVSLEGSTEADVAIIGGGFTGFRAAIELSERGVSVAVIDAEEPGWGASGRSGGQVNPLPHILPEAIIKVYGAEHAERFFEAIAGAADELFGVVRKHDIKCEHYQNGWIQAAHRPSILSTLSVRQKEWSRRGIEVETVTRQEIIDLIGSPGYHGGILFKRGGAIHPLSFTRGLAHAAVKSGVRVFSKTRAESLERGSNGWTVICNDGAGHIRCENVILATNGYTGDRPISKLKRTITPICTIQAASEPLSDSQLKIIMPNRTTLAGTRRALFYTRRTGKDRICLGALAHNFSEIRKDDKHRIDVGLNQVFPQLRGLKWEYYWNGIVAHTPHRMPLFHEPAPGVFAGIGFNGRGVAMSTVMGRVLAERVMGADPKNLPFPTLPIAAAPFHELGRFGLRIAIGYFEMMDAIDNYQNRSFLRPDRWKS